MRQLLLAIPVGLMIGVLAAFVCQAVFVFAWRYLPKVWWNTAEPMDLLSRAVFFGLAGAWLLFIAAVSQIFGGWVVKIVDLRTRRVRILPRVYSKDDAGHCAAYAARNGPSSLKYERRRFLWV